MNYYKTDRRPSGQYACISDYIYTAASLDDIVNNAINLYVEDTLPVQQRSSTSTSSLAISAAVFARSQPNNGVPYDIYRGVLSTEVEGKHLPVLDIDGVVPKCLVQALTAINLPFIIIQSSIVSKQVHKHWVVLDYAMGEFEESFSKIYEVLALSRINHRDRQNIDFRYFAFSEHYQKFFLRAFPKEGFMPTIVHKHGAFSPEMCQWLDEYKNHWETPELCTYLMTVYM